jgi:hypothetical protein
MTTKTKTTKKWSADVTEHSDAMDLEKDIFKSGDPDKIAASVKHSAENEQAPEIFTLSKRHVNAHILREQGGKKLKCR